MEIAEAMEHVANAADDIAQSFLFEVDFPAELLLQPAALHVESIDLRQVVPVLVAPRALVAGVRLAFQPERLRPGYCFGDIGIQRLHERRAPLQSRGARRPWRRGPANPGVDGLPHGGQPALAPPSFAPSLAVSAGLRNASGRSTRFSVRWSIWRYSVRSRIDPSRRETARRRLVHPCRARSPTRPRGRGRAFRRRRAGRHAAMPGARFSPGRGGYQVTADTGALAFQATLLVLGRRRERFARR